MPGCPPCWAAASSAPRPGAARAAGLTALELGDEAIVNVADFSLQGRSMRNVRQMVTRVCRHGYVAEIRRVARHPPRGDRGG